MKKVLIFAATIKLISEKRTGIMKKVFAETAIFEKQYDVYLWGFGERDIRYYHNGELTVVDTFKNKFERRKKYFKAITKFTIENKASFFYFRYASTDFFLISTFRKIKAEGTSIICEIPSYPYKGEFKDSFKKRLIYLLDLLLRRKLGRRLWSPSSYLTPA